MSTEASANDQQMVEELDRAWNDAYVQNDRTRLVPILAEDFEATAADGRRVGKALLLQPSPAPKSVVFSERFLSVFGTTAVTRGRVQVEHDAGRIDQRFMRVYAKRDGRWQAVAVQVFPVPS